jgi:hypothetical protein
MQSRTVNSKSGNSGWGCSLQRAFTAVLLSYILEHYTNLHDHVGLTTGGDAVHVE